MGLWWFVVGAACPLWAPPPYARGGGGASLRGIGGDGYFSALSISTVWFQNISTVFISMRSSGLWTPRSVGP